MQEVSCNKNDIKKIAKNHEQTSSVDSFNGFSSCKFWHSTSDALVPIDSPFSVIYTATEEVNLVLRKFDKGRAPAPDQMLPYRLRQLFYTEAIPP